MTLRQDAKGQIFLADLRKYSRVVWPRMTKFGMITGGRSVFLGVSHAPIPRGPSPSIPKIFGTSFICEHGIRNNIQILHGDQSRCEEKFYTIDLVPCPGQNFWQMLMRDLFAVANFLALDLLCVAVRYRFFVVCWNYTGLCSRAMQTGRNLLLLSISLCILCFYGYLCVALNYVFCLLCISVCLCFI